MYEKLATFNGVNMGAITFSFLGMEQILTILVLLSALAYNIRKLQNEDKNNKRDDA